ncbi:hypothetical protein [Chryseobacterium indoltheticum]|uniref:HNH endonuclease n=1 Tax=Chryseobacterium indoltheticum TaxID=254 RepID=A0A381FGM0_9FLAO|nr:hypothetical protein [Chryseobacterium indoltheticum]SUX45674.1 Uncharacterised protein [Chryseobacterium indoltheticum]
MIKIQEHLSVANPENFLLNLAESHWDNLNPKMKDGKKYKSTSLLEICKKYYAFTVGVNYIRDYAFNNKKIALKHRSFFKFLIKNKNENLKKLIIGRPDELENLKIEILKILDSSHFYIIIKNKPSLTKFGELLLNKIFNYKKFRRDNFCKELFLKLDFINTTCPYCNENLLKITTIISNSTNKAKNKAYLDIDHFFSKVYYPYFAISFYNLIPSCHDCNSLDKGDKVFNLNTHIHPYLESFDDHYYFKISLITVLGDTSDEIQIVNKNTRPSDLTILDIKLVERYQTNLEKASSLVSYFIKYKHHIGSEFEESFKEAMWSHFPKERTKILKIERAKMNRDILKQIDITSFLEID